VLSELLLKSDDGEITAGVKMHTRISVRTLMALVILLGLELAALRSCSVFWFKTSYSLTLASLFVAILAARFRDGTFWFGFALFGWGYFLLGLGPFEPSKTYEVGVTPNPNLWTHDLVEFVLENATRVPEIRRFRTQPSYAQEQEAFARVRSARGTAHLILTALSAIAGAIATSAFVTVLGRQSDRNATAPPCSHAH
jgi:hypothetical protein